VGIFHPDVYDGWSSFRTAWTNASGEYAVGGLPTGTYFARTLDAQYHVDEAYSGLRCIDCSPTSGGTPIPVTEERRPRASISPSTAAGTSPAG